MSIYTLDIMYVAFGRTFLVILSAVNCYNFTLLFVKIICDLSLIYNSILQVLYAAQS